MCGPTWYHNTAERRPATYAVQRTDEAGQPRVEFGLCTECARCCGPSSPAVVLYVAPGDGDSEFAGEPLRGGVPGLRPRDARRGPVTGAEIVPVDSDRYRAACGA